MKTIRFALTASLCFQKFNLLIGLMRVSIYSLIRLFLSLNLIVLFFDKHNDDENKPVTVSELRPLQEIFYFYRNINKPSSPQQVGQNIVHK